MNDLRIYADFNALRGSPRTANRWSIPLNTLGSVRDLSNAGLRLRDGVSFTVYDWSDETEDLEAFATAIYDATRKYWLAEFDESGYRYFPKRDRHPDTPFLCLDCRGEIHIAHSGFHERASCPACGTSVMAAVAPP